MLDTNTEELLRILNSDQPQVPAAQYLAERAQQLLGASGVAYLRPDPEQGAVYLEASCGFEPIWSVDEWDADLLMAVFGLLLDNEPDCRLLDLSDAVWWDDVSQKVTGLRSRAWLSSLREKYEALLVMPMWIRDDLAGVFLLLYPSYQAAARVVPEAARKFSLQASLVAENARLRRRAEQAAVMQERSRLARDLHDSVTQSLYSLTLLAEAARRLVRGGEDPDQVLNVANRLGEIGQQALKEMRLLVYQLRPSVLRRVGLVRALSQRLETVERRAGVEAALLVESDLALPAALEEQLYYLVQEALNNALKHAAASAIEVRITGDGEHLRVEITDDGNGFIVEDVGASGGFGLSSMQERVEKLNGSLAIDSTPGKGTTVSVTLSMAAASGLAYDG